MGAQIIVQKRHAVMADRMSRKSARLIMLFGVLLAVSIAVNAMIIVASGIRP